MKQLPLGIQDFERLRLGNNIYVDKTEWIYDLLQSSQGFYFLSRPRRFGKSLLLSTLKCLFEGKKELFEGLWIHEKSDITWEKHPVITLDFNTIGHETPESLRHNLRQKLDSLANEYEVSLQFDSISGKFSNLITALAKKQNRAVVVLIDEYDKAIVNHLGKGAEGLKIATQNRDVLKELFGVLKGQGVSGSLRFLMLTGVTKFSRVSVFSDLNHLKDLTMNSNYCELLGYTEEELSTYFDRYIVALAEKLKINLESCKEKLRSWYNGYRFTEEDNRVYNPFSILSVLGDKKFKNYWFETGTPIFLVELIKQQEYPILTLENLKLDELSLSNFEIDLLDVEPLLFQTGYLTIKGYEEEEDMYQLSWPNQEVKKSFLKFLFRYLVKTPQGGIEKRFLYLSSYLKNRELEEFVQMVNTILASIPYQHIANRDEYWFHAMFYLMLSASGVEVFTEMINSKGRLDIAVLFPNKTYVIELKCNQTAKAAIQQIKNEGYADRYRDPEKELILMGLNFDSEKREITDWDYEPKMNLSCTPTQN